MSITVTGHITLPTGVIVPATGTAPLKAGTMFGSDRSPITSAMSTFPKLAYTRVYCGPGKGIKLPTGVPANVLMHMSFKDTPAPTFVNPALDLVTCPQIWEFHHEFEGDMPIVDYRSGVTALTNMVRAHKNGHWIKIAQTFTRYAQVHGKVGPDGLPATWQAAFVPTTDLIGFDCEIDKLYPGYPVYPDPAVFFSGLITASKTLGKPFIIPELGWPRMPFDANGTQLAAWYVKVANYLRSQECYAVAAYDTNGSTANYILVSPELAAWQSVF